MTSSVPNLGHVFSILVMSCTYLPSFKVPLLWEVCFLKITYDVIMTSSVPKLGECIFNPGDVLYLPTKFQGPTPMGSMLSKNDDVIKFCTLYSRIIIIIIIIRSAYLNICVAIAHR